MRLEPRAAGIKEFIFVTSRGKGALEDYFDHAPALESELRKKGKDDLLQILKAANMDSGAVVYVRQHQALGLGHAVWCAKRLIGKELFAAILPDDVIEADKPCLAQMVDAFNETQSSVVAAMEVPADKASSYGILDGEDVGGNLVCVKGMVEKPVSGEASSNLVVIGRYMLTSEVLRSLNKMKTGTGGEIQLTDAIAAEIEQGRSVQGLRFDWQRCDRGSKAGFLQSTVAFALEREELREELSVFLQDLVEIRHAAE